MVGILTLEDIESYEYIDCDYVHDIEVENNHCYYINAGKEILVHNSGKTYSILQVLFSIAISVPRATITVVGETIPNLKSGALRDALDIYNTSEELKQLVVNYNKSDRIFEFKSGSIIEFKSYMDSQSAKSGKRDYLFINEANGISMDIFNELHLRTRVRTFIDYNPNYEFWVHEYLIGKPNVQLIISDHRHNPFISDKIRSKIEALKDIDIELWNVYARGRTGKVEGLIFRNWIRSFIFPRDAKLIGYGIDFGYSCFSGDTMISTNNGEKRIDTINIGDYVLTSKGYKKVLKTHNNGVKKIINKIIELDFGLIEISATFEHLIKTQSGWKQLGKLQKGDILSKNALLMGKSIEDMNNTSTLTTSLVRTKKDYIELFGNFITELFQMGSLYITWMVTHLIITFLTFVVLLFRNMQKFTSILMAKVETNTQKKTGRKEGKSQWKGYFKKNINASHVARSLPRQMFIKSIALLNAIINTSIVVLSSWKHIYVFYADKHSKEINTLNKKHAHQNAHIHLAQIKDVKTKIEYYDTVYDLTVQGQHEYFANGILVHNCDPTAIVEMRQYEGELHIKELFYESGLTNNDISNRLHELGISQYDDIVCDSAEPKSIEELRRLGWRVEGANKGPDSIINSIDILKRYKMNIVGDSNNLIKELNTYKWKVDRTTGKSINEPIDYLNHCFTEDTLITTINGLVEIKDIKVGDMVLTSKGYKKVLKKFNNGLKQVNNYSILLDTFVVNLCSTKEHKIKTSESWKQISELQSGQMVYLHKPSMELIINYIQKKDISQSEEKECTEKYGSITMDRFLKLIKFIIKIIALGTITLITWSWSKLISIYQNMARKSLLIIRNGSTTFTQRESRKQKSGTSHLKESNGIDNTQENLNLDFQRMERLCVLYAQKNSLQKQSIINSAQTIANQNIEEEAERTTLKDNAIIVEKDLLLTSIQLKELVTLNVQESYMANVYDLMVEDEHEYFANGILVHNCTDAIRYIALNKLAYNNKGVYHIY